VDRSGVHRAEPHRRGALPRGYFMGLQYSLAEILCSEYGMGVPPDIKRFAKEFRDILKAQNATPQSEAAIDGAIRSPRAAMTPAGS
jgi:hypothetical protein